MTEASAEVKYGQECQYFWFHNSLSDWMIQLMRTTSQNFRYEKRLGR
jgi:hypothetical protein